MRTGPSPLWLHLNAAAAMMASASNAVDMFDASRDLLSDAISGIHHYHQSPVTTFHRQNMIVAYDNHGTKLLTHPDWSGGKPTILIPSLINGWAIFDIEEKHSFCAFLASHGFTPYIVQWARPEETVQNYSMDDYLVHHLAPLLIKMHKNTPIHTMIGYCMGATFIPATMSLLSQNINAQDMRIGMIAPPWDFTHQTWEQKTRLHTLGMQTHVMEDLVPDEFIQSLFWAIDPTQVIKKFSKFPNITNPDRFVRVEDWLNTPWGVSKSVIQTCLFEWYNSNAIMNGQWIVDGRPVDDTNLPPKTCIIMGENDNLVPPQFSTPLTLTRNRHTITVNTGHIGLMASDKAINGAWKPLVDFIMS